MSTRAAAIRAAWMFVFLLGTALLIWREWSRDDGSAMAGYLFSGLWSATCGIGYTVSRWCAAERLPRRTDSP